MMLASIIIGPGGNRVLIVCYRSRRAVFALRIFKTTRRLIRGRWEGEGDGLVVCSVSVANFSPNLVSSEHFEDDSGY
jgi:hypothetical protein